MNPSELIRNQLGEDVWKGCSASRAKVLLPAEDLSPFPSSKTYRIHGGIHEFDIRWIRGSDAVFDVDDQRAIRLTRAGKEIEIVLKENWHTLAACDPVVLARLILMFFDGGIRSRHHVLPDVEALHSFRDGYVLHEKRFERVRKLAGSTSIHRDETTIVLRAITLCGWMHLKRNLGVENIHISESGEVRLGERELLSRDIFESVPGIRY